MLKIPLEFGVDGSSGNLAFTATTPCLRKCHQHLLRKREPPLKDSFFLLGPGLCRSLISGVLYGSASQKVRMRYDCFDLKCCLWFTHGVEVED